MQNWLKANGFTEKNDSPPSFTDLNPLELDYHVWDAMLKKYDEFQLKAKTMES